MGGKVLPFPRRIHRRRKKHSRHSELPGTVVAHPHAVSTQLRITQYDSKKYHQQESLTNAAATSALDEIETSPKQVTWIDIGGLRDTDLIHKIGNKFKLHALALEDAVNTHQRPKVDVYHDHVFVVAHAHLPDANESLQVALFLGSNFVISFHESNRDCFATVRKRISASQGRIRDCGADYLLYVLLDMIVDGYFPALEHHGERLDALDNQIYARTEQNLIDEIHSVRTELLTMRRSIWPLRDAINTLIRGPSDFISTETGLYLRDCYDHTIQLIDVMEADRELCADLRDFYLTTVSNRMNQVMKFLTIIATLFIPLSFITGLYGMNFNTKASSWNMPELNWTAGYPFALGLMTAMACGLLYFFWRKGWLT